MTDEPRRRRRTAQKPRRSQKAGRGALRTPLRTAKGRTTSSAKWLERQLNDPYVAAAKEAGYRSRAAFKLAQIDDKFSILRPGGCVVDLGAAPGGWSQVAVERTGPKGHVIALDIEAIDPIPNVEVIAADILDPGTIDIIAKRLNRPATAILSDMAAPSTGHRQTDHLRVIALCEAALAVAVGLLSPGGAFVAKVLRGGTEQSLLLQLKRRFNAVRHFKPPTSRSDSAEIYVVATGFRGNSS